MAKKFDVVIGNPPYQEEAGGTATHQVPLYHLFMDAAFEVGVQAVLITPARFLFNGGFTPKAWNLKMLNDEHLSVAHYEPDSKKLFPGLADPIKGGIAVTYRDANRKLGPIGSFAKNPKLDTILEKVSQADERPLQDAEITSSRSYRYTPVMHDEHPAAAGAMAIGEQFKINTRTFELLPGIFYDRKPLDDQEYAQILGIIKNKRFFRWVRRDYVAGPASFDKFKVAVPAANGSGSTTDFFGVALNNPLVLGPGFGVTQTFLTIGSFDTEDQAQACLKYISTKFARAMLGVLKATQHNPAATWKHVPLQDFSVSSDIDWSKSIPEIDQQLYAKYNLDEAEIAFIEANVKRMS